MPRRQKRDRDGLYQRDRSPYWWASFTGADGRPTRRSTGVRVSDDPRGLKAAAVRAAWVAESPALTPSDAHTWDELMVLYLQQVSPHKRAPDRDRWSARALRPLLTGAVLETLGVTDVRRVIAARTKQGAAPGTLNKEIGLCSAATRWAQRELEWTIPNPWAGRRLREPSGRARWLTHAEAAALLSECLRRAPVAPWLHPWARLCLYAGLRPGEALGLAWSRVDLARGWITLGADDSKAGKPARVPINAEARAALIDRARYRATHCPGSPWVMCRKDGTRVQSIRRAFGSAVAAAGLEDVHPHDLRRTCGSWLVQAGVGIERVSALLRHSDVSVTARVYAHLRPQDLADTAGILDQMGAGISHSDFTLADRPEGDEAQPTVTPREFGGRDRD